MKSSSIHVPAAVDAGPPIKCARVAQRERHEVLRYLVLAVAFAAVVLLIAIAVYYTHGSASHMQHFGLLGPKRNLRV